MTKHLLLLDCIQMLLLLGVLINVFIVRRVLISMTISITFVFHSTKSIQTVNQLQKSSIKNFQMFLYLLEIQPQVISVSNKFHVHQSQAQIEIHLAFTWRSPGVHLTTI